MIEQTQIGNEGLGHLSKAKWLNLSEINLCKSGIKLAYNNITSEGLLSLEKCDFPALKLFHFLFRNKK